MKTFIAVLAMVLVASTVFGSPFLVCDPQAGVTSYQLTGWTPTTVTAESNGSLRMDVASAVVGNTSLTIKACKNDAIWGTQCSSATPFSFLRPSAPSVPSGTVLAP
jgi:hypothetical protein